MNGALFSPALNPQAHSAPVHRGLLYAQLPRSQAAWQVCSDSERVPPQF